MGGGGEVEEEMLEKEKRGKGKEKGKRSIHNMNGSLSALGESNLNQKTSGQSSRHQRLGNPACSIRS